MAADCASIDGRCGVTEESNVPRYFSEIRGRIALSFRNSWNVCSIMRSLRGSFFLCKIILNEFGIHREHTRIA